MNVRERGKCRREGGGEEEGEWRRGEMSAMRRGKMWKEGGGEEEGEWRE